MITASKTVIITGGNSGLGYQCAKNLAKHAKNYHILLACRNPQKAAQAVKDLIDQTDNPNIHAMELDLSSLASVRNFYKAFSEANLPPLYAVVCNAGTGSMGTGKNTVNSKDGFELTFGVNHLGHFLLANLLLQKMADTGRIVFVSSDTHDPSPLLPVPTPTYTNARRLAYPDKNSVNTNASIGILRYATSKLCNIYCTYEMAKRIQSETDKQVTINAFNPGFMSDTGLSQNCNPALRFINKYFVPVLALITGRLGSSKKSGELLASLVTNPQLNTTTGRYFDRTKEIESSALSYNTDNAKELWKTSIELVNLQKNETIFSI
jgi:light-dependent protochlorophyllide reductase